jgi:outer membrane protein OmpA-like peptidoglycan-associated protein
VALNRMSTISYGDTSPVATNKTRAGRAQNRRVAVIVLE